MRTDKPVALKMRAEGNSYKIISRELGIPKSTLYEWFKSLPWSEEVKQALIKQPCAASMERMRLATLAMKQRWQDYRAEKKAEATAEFAELASNPLFVSGIMLYWAEGETKGIGCGARFSNTDPRMVKIMLDLAEQICKVPKNKIRLTLILYPDLAEDACKTFWSEQLSVPLEQFYKTQFIEGKEATKRLRYGICAVKMGNLAERIKINTWIDLCAEHFMRL